MRARLAPIFFAALCFAAPAAAQPARAPGPPTLTERPVDGTSVRRMESEIVVQAPFEAVARLLRDYAAYPSFLPRFRTARVVQRTRAHTQVYFQLELPRALGTLWFLHEMSVTRDTADALEIQGVARSGSVGRVETTVSLERLPAHGGVRFRFALFGLPALPALPDTVNGLLRDAVRAAAILLRARAEGTR